MRHQITLFLLYTSAAFSTSDLCRAQSYIYVTNGSADNISGYVITPATGALAAVPGSPFTAGSSPASIVVDPAGRFAYAANLDSYNVSAYTINPSTGSLTAVSGSPFDTGSQPISVAVDPTGQFVYVANTLSNNVSAYQIDPSSGVLTAVSGSPFPAGTYPNSVAVDPTGQFVYVANFTSGNVSAYTINPASGSLSAVAGSPFGGPTFPYSVTVDPTGQFVYVANRSNSVSAYAISPATGALTALAGSPVAAGSEPTALTVDPTGRFLYVTNPGSNNVSAYTIDPGSGALTPLTGSPFPTVDGPYWIAVDPSGQFVYVTSVSSANVSAYTVNSTAGALSAVSGSPFPTGGNSESIAVTSVNGPALGIASSHAGNFIQGQAGVTYTVTISNAGPGATNGVITITERVPAGLSLVSMAGSGWTCPAGSVICTRIDSLAAGASYPAITVTMNVAGDAPVSVTNVVTVSGVGSPMAVASDTTTIVQLPALTVSCTNTGGFSQGEMGATYSVTVTNAGSAPTVGTVTVSESLPSGLALVSLGGTGWICPSSGTSCTRSDPLNAGASYSTITVTVNVAANAPPSVTNQVSVSGGGSVSATASDVTTIPQPLLVITKSHAGSFTQGQNGATYTVTVSNAAPVPPALTVSNMFLAIGSASCNDSQSLNVTSSDGSNQSFSAAIQYANVNPYGHWLYVSDTNGYSTTGSAAFNTTTGASGILLTVGLQEEIGSATPQATVVLTPADGSAPVDITVFYTQNTSCGGNTGSASNGFLTVTPANVSLTAGTNSEASQSVTIQNLIGTGTTFGFSVSPANSWLSATASSTNLSAGGTASVNVTANANQTAGVGTYTGTLTITPGSGFGSSINIPVTFTVTSGSGTGPSSGTLTVGNTGNSNYTANFNDVFPNAPADQCVPLQDTASGADYYTVSVNTANGVSWLLANGQISTTVTGSLAPGAGACVDLRLSNAASSLASGAYQGTVSLTSSSGATATITVDLYISAGQAPGISGISPGLIYVFGNVAPNSSVQQEEVFQVTAANGYTMGTASLSSEIGGFSINTPVFSNNTQLFTVISNSTGLAAGLYATTVTITSTSDTANNTTTITIVLPVGQPGTSGTNAAVAPLSLAFQQQQGSPFWTSGREAQGITIAGQSGTQWSAAVVYGSGANWLDFDSPGNGTGTFGSTPATLAVDLFNGITSLAPSSTLYQATVSISTPGGATIPVSVSLLVTPSNTPVFLGLPASVTFSATTGSNPPAQTVTVVGSDNTSSTTTPTIIAGTPSASWVTAATTGNTMTIGVSPAGLSTGIYSATIPVSASAYVNPILYPVVMIVDSSGASSGPLTLNPTSISFTGVTSQASENLSVSASTTTSYTAAPSETTCTGATWLTLSPSGAQSTATAPFIAVTANPGGIASGTICTGAISLVTSTGTQTVSVSMTVGTSSAITSSTATQTASVSMTVGTSGGSTSTSGTVTVTENLPAGLALVSMAGTGWTCPTGGNTCTRSDSLGGAASYPPIAVSVNVANDAPTSVTNQVSVSGGGSLQASASDTTAIISPCALTQDGTPSVADIQKVVNEALGLSPSADDLNLDGVVNAVDVRIVIAAAIGLGCSL